MTSSLSLPSIGSLIDGRFEISEIIGEGGFGVVYRAQQLGSGQPVAIKFLHPEKLLSSRDPDQERARFRREMELIGRLRHPNIVRLIDTGELEKGQLYTVLEFAEGESLSALLRREGALSARLAQRLMLQILEGLHCAHTQRIVHRDLKPANIMVSVNGGRHNAMVLDFGIAGILGDDEDFHTLTRTGQIQGTPPYMAPEQLEGKRDARSDLYAWGLVFLECLSGVPVVTAPSIPAMIFKQLSEKPVPIPEHLQGTILGDILTRAVAKPLDQRFQSAAEILMAFEDHSTHSLELPTSAQSASPHAFQHSQTLDLESTPPPELEVTQEELHPKAGTSKRAWLPWVLSLLLAGGLFAALIGPGIFSVPKESPSNEASELSGRPCPPGRIATSKTYGECCYPDQSWNGSACVGLPSSCPEGFALNSEQETCLPKYCPGGSVRTFDGAHCCWSGQFWEEKTDQCAGIPTYCESEIPFIENGEERFLYPDQKRCFFMGKAAKTLHLLCKEGDTQACTSFASRLLSGDGAELNIPKAQKLLEESCNLGVQRACTELGISILPSPKATSYFKGSCEAQDPNGCFFLSSAQFSSKNSNSHKRGCESLGKACALGDEFSCYRKAMRAVDMEECATPDSSISDTLHRACKGGVVAACTQKALLVLKGLPHSLQAEKDLQTAAKMLNTACEHDEGLACIQALKLSLSVPVAQQNRTLSSALHRAICELGFRLETGRDESFCPPPL